VLTPEGRVFFAGEPITADFPMPWGLRLDGNSLWAIRKNGWLELGFREDYFRQALEQTGWSGMKLPCSDPGWMTLWEARRRDQPVFRATAADPRLNTVVGQRTQHTIEIKGGKAGTGLYGPYITLPAGTYIARIRFRSDQSSGGQARMDIVTNVGMQLLAERIIEGSAISAAGATFALPFTAKQDLVQLEVRLLCEKEFHAIVEAVEILVG
jgi:hypothetical protein